MFNFRKCLLQHIVWKSPKTSHFIKLCNFSLLFVLLKVTCLETLTANFRFWKKNQIRLFLWFSNTILKYKSVQQGIHDLENLPNLQYKLHFLQVIYSKVTKNLGLPGCLTVSFCVKKTSSKKTKMVNLASFWKL